MKTQEAIQLFVTNRQLNLAVSTVHQYKQQLSRMLEFSDKVITNPADIESIIASISGSQETKHSYYRTYKAFYNFLSKRYDIPNVMKDIVAPKVNPKVMPTLEANEVGLLSLFTKNTRNNTLIALFLDTGIRSSEATTLKRENIKEDYIIVKGKVGQRIVPISSIVRSALLRLPEYEDGYVFHGLLGHGHNEKLGKSGAYNIVKEALLRVGVTGSNLGPHRLRHTFGRHWITLGGDIRSLQIILGHSNIRTTEKYANLNFNDISAKHKKYSPAQLMEATSNG